jgi:signal transduction histidine kinase
VISNLITNAIKFSPKNSEINIKATPFYDLNVIHIEVEDNGVGLQ